MITINFKRRQETIPVQVDEGMTIMEAARDYGNLPEIPGDCGGCCACATCHIKVDESWIDKIGKVNESSFEGSLIEYEKGYDPNMSRLGCQIQLKKEHDGLIVHLLDNHKI
jgi:ferredoxin, 2Fe-2S